MHGRVVTFIVLFASNLLLSAPEGECLDDPHAINVAANGRETRNLVAPSSQERNIEPTKPGKV